MSHTSPPQEMTTRQIATRVASTYLKPRWKGVTVAVLCTITVALVSTQLAQILEPAINNLLVRPKPGAILWIPLTIVALALTRAVAQILQSTLINRIGHGIVGDIQIDLFGRMMRADLARLRATHSGTFVSSVLYDAGLIREAATSGMINYTQNFLIVAGMLIVMADHDLVLTLGVMLIGPFAGRLMRRFTRRSKKAAKGAMAATGALSTALMESLDGVRVVKIENREDAEQARVAEVIGERQKHLIKGSIARAQAAPVTELLTMVVTAAVFAYAGWRAANGQMNVGDFTAFMGALAMAGQSLRQLANLQTVFTEGGTAARRLFAALDVEPEVADREGAIELPVSEGHIRFEDVTFGYGEGGPALEGVTLEARRGETIALVGPSGGGKSTILSLIPRFYDATSGRVSIDGTDVREVTLASLRHKIGLVTQEPFLFDDSIKANIAYAKPDASQAEIETAAKLAAAHDFILEQPNGYDTVVGESAARLSGGQRQRIAIARAFLKDAPILLLDEATSALDTESEAQVQQALERLMHGRTTIVIAHRLSTVKDADRIYVIERGAVVEQGTHASLVRRKGLYARLARAQDLDTLPEPAAE
ncbi:subfamily B ATP-binding cassette protein MsbA [Caulobacter ginsengisoli]|uniref:Subfamily B ATP-binding cassette protein MsbA n=1 Tax=Caulobacter ginsengisoli TaxID=400775 RepID=A0ABU0IY27_9CAUL|nr:ABC transporter ATP-binding protein [Caulobacter ginsengisoli]MDQ0466927.1 subfamily B ATP-binding cassette protein MsbA [Caulobacter ginsengisoli]